MKELVTTHKKDVAAQLYINDGRNKDPYAGKETRALLRRPGFLRELNESISKRHHQARFKGVAVIGGAPSINYSLERVLSKADRHG